MPKRCARAQSSVTAVSIRDRDEIRVSDVFDFGPPLGFRARVGEAIALVPPFGASLIAWDDDEGIQTWFDRADPPLAPAEVAHYRAALAGIRRRGFSVTLVTARQPVLIDALERLADDSGGGARRARDEAVRQMTHSEYLAAEIEPDRTVRVAQVSAPVFQADGRVAATIMSLGPTHEVTADEITELGNRVAATADAATTEIQGRNPGSTLRT